MDIPEKGKLAAHVLIDAVSVSREPGDGAPDLAYQRLREVEAVGVVVEDNPDGDLRVTVELSAVLGASMVTLDWLIEQLVMSTGRSRESIIFALREYIDA